MKKLIVVAVYDNTLAQFSRQLSAIFGDLLAITICHLKDLEHETLVPDCVALSLGQYYYPLVSSFFSEAQKGKVVMAKKNVNVANLRPILALPKGEKLLVINDHEETTAETTKQLNETLFEYTFVAYEMNQPVPEDIHYIVTPDETEFIPKTNRQVINIGQRVLSIDTILDLYDAAELQQVIPYDRIVTRYIKSLMTHDAEDQINQDVLKPEVSKLVEKIEKHGFLEESLAMLRVFKEGKQKNEAYGRQKVQKLLEEQHVFCSEQQVRIRIKILNDLGLINVRKGRGGSTISKNGELFLEHIALLKEK